jgi:hypothetical protein
MHFSYSSLGEQDQAFAWLDKAFAARDGALITLNASLPLMRLRPDARYADLERRIGVALNHGDAAEPIYFGFEDYL